MFTLFMRGLSYETLYNVMSIDMIVVHVSKDDHAIFTLEIR